VEELLTELKREVTLVLVTHNIRQAARIADRSLFLLLGELVEEGPTAELFANPIDARTESFLSGRFG
jgi:phosphate transport system ATP-binding protein